jgi:phosphoglycerate dehydrogenase-like enzyme
MKSKINLLLRGNDQGLQANTHPVFMYSVQQIADSNLFDFTITTDSSYLKSIVELYGFDCALIHSENGKLSNETIPTYDLRFPLMQSETLFSLLQKMSLEQFEQLCAEDVKAICDTKIFELLSPYNPLEAMLIQSFISSEFNWVRPHKLSSGYIIERPHPSTKPKLLFSAPYKFFSMELRGLIEEQFEVTYAFNAPYSETASLLQGVEYWITGTCPPYMVDSHLIDSSSVLKIVATPSTGTNHIDVKYLAQKGIQLLSIKDSPVIEDIHASSEFSFALMLAVIKKIPFATGSAKMGIWRELESEFRNIELFGKTIGLVGLGRIGKKMAGFCKAFGMNVIGYDPFVSCTLDYVNQYTELEELLTTSDIVSLHYHLNPATTQSFHSYHFNKMKPGSYFINTARGELVVEKDLLQALSTGHVKAAGVDVISNEHILHKWNHPLIQYARNNDNLLISPHIAGCTVDSESKAMRDLLNQLLTAIK